MESWSSAVVAEFRSAQEMKQYQDNKRAIPELLNMIGELLPCDGPMRSMFEERVQRLNVGCVPGGKPSYQRNKTVEESIKAITPCDSSQMLDFYFHLQHIVDESHEAGFNTALSRIQNMQWKYKESEDDEDAE
jgi:hypothetical protein